MHYYYYFYINCNPDYYLEKLTFFFLKIKSRKRINIVFSYRIDSYL